jgi:hypothetical protein
MAAVAGSVAMGCEEILVHAGDVAEGLGVPFAAPIDLSTGVVARLFARAPGDAAPWDALRRAAGRIARPDRERLGADWHWHCAPLAEWDGTLKLRTAPPAWR